MGLMDKVKAQAEQAIAKAQQGVSQGQAKIEEVQAKRQSDVLLRDLGAAYYAQQRSGGPADAVDAAMKLVDEFVAAHGSLSGSGGSGTGATTAGPGGAGTSSATGGAPGGNFSINDM